MKKILIIATGGTIASRQTAEGLVPGVSSQALRDSVPEAGEFCTLDAIQLLNIDSTNIQPEHWLMMVQTVEKHFADYDGFVITHGTDTMAYTAAALSYLIQNPGKPIVLTGSQKPLLSPITDAKKNLMDALRFACQKDVSGVYLVFSGEAILGTRAKKVRSKSYAAFASINYPVAAFIDGSRVIRYMDQSSAEQLPRFYHTLVPRVFVLKLIPGMEPDILDYICDHYDAIIIESYGVGGLPFMDQRNFLEKLENLSKNGRIIVIATQVLREGSDAATYEVGRRAMSRYDLLQAYDMTIEAAVTKLMWLLGQTKDPALIREGFYTPVAKDILTGDTE
ncbi:MAG: asparaginase [Oscillospiraceae bacterium]|nr:asparaginase [Oscillospiraceae bacterium]